MTEQLNFPPHVGVPGNGNPPTIDGYIEIDPAAPTNELPNSSGIDLGWTQGSMLTYAGGSLPQVEIRAIRDNSQAFIYLGFIVRSDPFFDDEDVIVLAFQDSYNGAAHATNERRMHIFPLFEDVGAQGVEDIPAYHVRADENPHTIEYYTWNGTAWVHPATLPTGIVARVRSWEPAGEKCWGVEVKIPINDDSAGGSGGWLNLANPFGFYANVVRVCGEVACAAGPFPSPGAQVDDGAAQQFTWPRANYSAPFDRIIQGALLQEIPPAWYGQGVFGAAGSGGGVKFLNHHAGIGVKQGASSTLSYKIEGDIGSPAVPAENKMTARLVNTGSAAANDVHAEFRIANWGLPPLAYTSWAKIPARNDTTNPNPNTNPTPAATIPVAVNNPPAGNDIIDLELWWKLNATERVDYLANSKHQCILVRLSSGQNVTFVEDSVRWNFDFDHLSKLTEVAQISGRGYPEPDNGSHHEFVLHVHRGKIAGEDRPSLTHFQQGGSVFQWSVHGYRQLPGSIQIQAPRTHKPKRSFHILEYIGSFGLHAVTKDANATELEYDLAGDTLKEVAEGVYRLEVPHNEDIYVRTRLAVGEKLEPEPWTPPKWTPPKDPGDGGGGQGGGKKPGCGTATATLLTLFGTLGAVLMHWRR
jgi:hypothetical protein